MGRSLNPPLCKDCADLSNKAGELTKDMDSALKFSDKTRRIIRIGLGVGGLVVMGLAAFFQFKLFPRLLGIHFAFLPYTALFFTSLAAVGWFAVLKRPSSKPKGERITAAQIETLLKIDDKLTPSRLASATNTSVEYAKKVLNDLAVEGKLNVSAGVRELIYSKDLLPEREA
jgi:hypothetical protein